MFSRVMSATPTESSTANLKPPIYKRKWFIIVAILMVLGLIGYSSEDTESAKSNSGSFAPTDTIELEVKTEYLEYSNKDVDPTTLVELSDKTATVAAKNTINLRKVGTQTAVYEISKNGDTFEQSIDFLVRDTKSPTIELADEKPSIYVGETYDPKVAVASVADEVDGDLSFVETPPEARGKNTSVEEFYEAGWYTLEGTIDSSIAGTHQIKVMAADKHGNTTIKEINVTVKEHVHENNGSAVAPSAEKHTYILNSNTGKFHHPGCSSINKMNEANKVEMIATRDEMIARGYDPCGRCNP